MIHSWSTGELGELGKDVEQISLSRLSGRKAEGFVLSGAKIKVLPVPAARVSVSDTHRLMMVRESLPMAYINDHQSISQKDVDIDLRVMTAFGSSTPKPYVMLSELMHTISLAAYSRHLGSNANVLYQLQGVGVVSKTASFNHA